MNLSEFKIGTEFRCGENRYRCTDVGTRVVVAICLGSLKVMHMGFIDLEKTEKTLTYEEANKDGWFNGPPYAVAEHIFDEDGLPACHLIA